jgi:hypothetical protein
MPRAVPRPVHCVPLVVAVLVPLLVSAVCAAAGPSGRPSTTDPDKADADFKVQGEYAGTIDAGGQRMAIGIQVIAEGDGAFTAVAYPGGLPGAGWTPPDKVTGEGRRDGAVVKIEGVDWSGTTRRGEIRDGSFVVLDEGGDSIGSLPKVDRTSPTLGQAPPAGAVVIFDGPGPADEASTVPGARITDDGLLQEGATSKASFGDARWHVEFRLPYEPHSRGQDRGNSGVYVQGTYEVQVLDSFGLEGLNNECGGIYSVAAPAVNMCLPPLSWQTYDIDFTAPRVADGGKATPARMTVRHNGVVVHDDVEVPRITPGGTSDTARATGPLHLQDHGNPVRYRNIWVLPKP